MKNKKKYNIKVEHMFRVSSFIIIKILIQNDSCLFLIILICLIYSL